MTAHAAHPTAPEPRADAPRADPDAVCFAEKPGSEFASIRHARILAPALAGMMPMVVIGGAFLLYLVLAHTVGVPRVAAAVVSVLAGAAVFLPVVGHARRIGHNSAYSPFYANRATGGHARIRVVIPRRRQSDRLGRWALAAAGLEDERFPGSEELLPVSGGFEPVIVRPWLGVSRGRGYWTTALGVGLCAAAVLVGFAVVRGSLAHQFTTLHIWGYGGLILGAAFGAAEFCFPAYLRLAPGRLDLFRYRFLGRGAPEVTSHDLRKAGLCINFGPALIAVEPPRAPGTPPPSLVLSKKWPHFQEHPPGHAPTYYCVALCRQRTEFCQRLVQAARADGPTPPLPEDRLVG